MMMLFSPLLSPPANTQFSLSFSAVASQDQAIVADRRRVGSINRNWTNYKADVPLYDGGRALSGGGGVLSLVLSLSLTSACYLLFSHRP